MIVFRHNIYQSTLLRGSWYPVALSDAATFNGVLANSQLYTTMQANKSYTTSDDNISLAYHSRALQIVNQKMKDPTQHTTESLLATVGSLMFHDVSDYHSNASH